MVNVARPLTRISEHLEELEDEMTTAEADGLISLDEWSTVRLRVRHINGDVCCTDLQQEYGATVARCGFNSPRAVRLRRQLEGLPALRLMEGGEDGNEAA